MKRLVIAGLVAIGLGLVALTILSLVSCVRVPPVPPATRTGAQQYDLAVAIETVCIGRDWIPSSKLASGVMVDGRHALTAAHVTACPFPPVVRITLASGESYRMAIEWESASKDLARLVIASAEILHIVPPVIAAPAVDDTVCAAVTMPGRQLNCGVIESIGSRPRSNIGMSAMIQVGNSGAGVYNRRGELVGIVSSAAIDQMTGFATRIAGSGVWP